MSRYALTLCLALLAAPGAAQEMTVTEQDDGSAVIGGTLQDIGARSGTSLRTPDAIAAQLNQMFRGDGEVDYAAGHIVDGPLRLSLTRSDGSVGFYDVAGDMVVFGPPGAFDEDGATYALTGLAIFPDPEAPSRLRADFGTLSMTRMD
ncbi:MAG: hypothetical protein AAGF60_15810 [Pseudomonadota bacterium]